GGIADVSRNAGIEDAILRAGHAVANHTYTHPFLPKLDAAQVDTEIDTTQALLLAAAPIHGRAPLFRPPYGARNPLVLAEIAGRGLRSVIWNIDSRDWADPIPQSIAQRVFDEAGREGHGIVLMHDIHGRTVQALPRVIEGLQKRGFRFAYWDGSGLKTQGDLPPINADENLTSRRNID
ncbi:MAG: polysaccharide deacetylase family protein, partial [Burkholderiales bacterium]